MNDTDKTILKVAGGVTLGALISKLLAAKPAEAAPVNEKLDYLIETDEAIVRLLGELKEGVDKLLEEEVVITRQVPLAYTVAPLETIKIAEPSPLSGKIESVTMHFPQNCNGLVDVAFGHGEVWVMPSELNTYIALNDACPTFPTKEPIEKNEHLWAEIRNGDGANPHSIAVIPTIIGTEV